jgi:hypothetical protein
MIETKLTSKAKAIAARERKEAASVARLKAATIKWQTEDDCTVCGHAGMTFELKEILPAPDIFGDPSVEAIGNLVCQMCGSKTESCADASMIPEAYWKGELK